VVKLQLMSAAVFAAAAIAASASAAPKFGEVGLDTQGMDRSVRPGDDFYAYMNGAWAKTAKIPADTAAYGNFYILGQQSLSREREIDEAAASNPKDANDRRFGDFYASFMDEAGIERRGLAPLAADLKLIAGIETPADLAREMSKLQRVQAPLGFPQSAFPVSPGVVVDLKSTDHYAAALGQGGLGLPDREYYLSSEPKLVAARDAYRAYLTRLFELGGFSEPQLRAAGVLDFETELARTHWTRIETRDLDKIYNPMPAANLARIAPGFDWKTYLQGAGFGGEHTIIVGEPTAMTGFAALAARTPLPVWRDYLAVRLIDRSAGVLPRAFDEASFNLYNKTLQGQEAEEVRWKRGVQLTDAVLGDAVGQAYVARYFPPESKAKVEAMVGEIKTALAQRIDRLAWMTPATKDRAKAKLADLEVDVGYPAHWRDYAGVQVSRDDALGNLQRAASAEYDRQLRKLHRPVDRTEWFAAATPQTVNAWNTGPLNKLIFPAAILQPPFFDPAADPAVNYGGMGVVMGHEISHSFDDQGSKLDEKGRLVSWWTASDVTAFKAATTTLADQYDKYEPLPGVRIQGRLTLGENVGDLGGLHAALDAYHASLGGKTPPVLQGFTGDQRFFLSYAQVWRALWREALQRMALATDPHSPNRFRVNEVRNMDAWYEAFSVKPGDAWYLPADQRVRIW
jgi:putative endopeptidase